jgi:hypothetical protein
LDHSDELLKYLYLFGKLTMHRLGQFEKKQRETEAAAEAEPKGRTE